MSTAETLREAADALSFLANSVRDNVVSEPYWDSEIVPASNTDGRYAQGIENAVGGVAGEYAAVLTPGVALALAQWLDATASRLAATTHPDWQDAVEPQALRVARAVLGEEARDGDA